MFDNNEMSSKILGNPAATQYYFLTELQKRTGGEFEIADPNNAFCLLGEFGSSLHAQYIKQENRKFDSLYSKRAKTAEDLYAKLSDYTYVNLTASPASCKFRILFNKDWIISNAIRYDDIYDIHVIPKETVITIAGIAFTLYYPIMIKVNRETNIITVEYDVNTVDKLKSMSTNLPYQVTEISIHGVTYLSIVFEAFQFVRTVYTETVDSSTGYYTKFSYNDKFYAAKVESYNSTTDSWNEMTYSLSKQNYDISTPTAILVFDNTSSTISVRIPQIYFTTGKVGNLIRTTIYSTKGTIDVTLSKADIDATNIDFMPGTSNYSAALVRNKDGIIVPYDQTRIEGGGDPVDFDTFKEAVNNQTLYDRVPISNLELESAVSKYGFTLTKHLDNLADNRIFYAGATLTNPSDGSLIPVVTAKVILTDPYNCSTIVEQSDGTMTILPTTIFKYNRVSNTSEPATDDELYVLSQMNVNDLIDTLNTDIYTRQPYHLWLDKNEQYPQAKAYNLAEPKMTSLLLQHENIHSTVMMNVVSVDIEHLADGTGGYKFYITVERSASLATDMIPDCKLLLQTNSRAGNLLTFEATYQTTNEDGTDIYTFDLPTTYRLSSDNYIQITVEDYSESLVTTDLGLTSKWIMKTLVNRAIIENSQDDPVLNTDVPYSYINTHLVTSQQAVTLELGESLEKLMFNQVTTTWGEIVYEKYTTDVPYTYDRDVYLTDRKGYLLTKIVTASDGSKSVKMVKLFSKGDRVLTKSETKYTLADKAIAGSNRLNLDSSTGILVGQLITGTNILPSTIVTNIDGNDITVSNNVMNDIDKGGVVILAATYTDTVTTQPSAAGSYTLTIGNTADIVNGMEIAAFGITEGSTVTDVKDGVITIDKPLEEDVASDATVAIFYRDGSVSYQYRIGDTVIDGNGKPVPTGERTNTFSIMTVQFDARLYESDDPTDKAFVTSLPSLLKSKSSALDPEREQLLEQTYLYYLPFRTIGDATYGIGDGKQISMPLEMSYSIVYYVSEATKSDTNVQTVIKTSTLNTINSYVQKGRISTSDLSYTLKSLFSGLVDSVTVSGVDNTNTTTLVIDTQGASPSIERKLTTNAAGVKVLVPNVDITFQVSPV